MEVDMVAGMEMDKVDDMVADMLTDKKINIGIKMEIQFGERVGHEGWLIGLKLFRPKAYLASSKLCEFISPGNRKKGFVGFP